MLPLLALGAGAGTLLLMAGRKREAAPAAPVEKSLAELVGENLDAPAAEREELAAGLERIGERELAEKLRAGRPAPVVTEALPGTPDEASIVAAIVSDWRRLGASDAACIQISPELVRQAQAVFGLPESGSYDLATAMAVQAVDPNAPSSCDWGS